MKIALITIHNANNYGAVLQAYATKLVLSSIGEVATINYNKKYLSHQLDYVRLSPSAHGVKKCLHDILRLPYRIKALRKFKKFIVENMNLTPKVTSEDLISGKAGVYDIYVCGSDQIWNPEIVSPSNEIDPIYFLSFAKSDAKKVSYASSIGNHVYTDKEKKEVKYLLEDFTLITTRESDGVKKLKEIMPDARIEHLLDPTLLLSKEEWVSALGVQQHRNKEQYILVYSVPRTDLLRKAVAYYSKKLRMKVVSIDQMLFPPAKVDRHVKDAGLEEFVEMFINADFVITDSFHGVCFSINFGKPFVSISAGKRANRITSLLSLLDIEDRLVTSEEEFGELGCDMEINKVLNCLSEIRTASKNMIVSGITL